MSELVTKPIAQEQQMTEAGAAVKRLAGLTIFVTVVTALAALLLAADNPQDKYSLISPGGIAFSDFRGYEDWPVASSARQDEILKVIVANPKMIKAYKAGIPGNGQPFPEGSMIVKLQWKQKKSTEAQFASLPRPSSWKRTVRDFRKPAGGGTRCSTTMPCRASSRPMPKAFQTAATLATRL